MPVVCAAVVGAKVRRAETEAESESFALKVDGLESRRAIEAQIPPPPDLHPSNNNDKKQNNPLYLETFSSPAGIISDAGDAHDDEEGGALRFHFAVHAALDAVDERVTRSSASASSSFSSSSSAAAAAAAQARARAGGVAPDSGEAYLGVLYPSDEFVVYG